MSIVRVSPVVLVVPAWLSTGDGVLMGVAGFASLVLILLVVRQVLFRMRPEAAETRSEGTPR